MKAHGFLPPVPWAEDREQEGDEKWQLPSFSPKRGSDVFPSEVGAEGTGGFCLPLPRGLWKEPASQGAPYPCGARLTQMNMMAQCGHGVGEGRGRLSGKPEEPPRVSAEAKMSLQLRLG